MTNPTSNFGWQMPTPTDLVTDLPADFEVFGQAVDTSMADLKGGTTGQILSKTTNADMDFTWITNDVGDITNIAVTSPITGGGSSGSVTIGVSAASTAAAGVVQLSDSTSTTSSVLASTPTATKTAYDLAAAAVPKSTVTTAGDVIYGTGSAAVTRLGIGTAGQVLTVNSGATAPQWSSPSTGAFTLLSTTALTGPSTLISSINQTYKSLFMVIYGVTNATANGVMRVAPNANTTGCSYVSTDSVGASFVSSVQRVTYLNLGTTAWSRTATNNVATIQIDNYTSSTNYKSLNAYGYAEETGGSVMSFNIGGAFVSNTAITSLQFSNAGGNLSTGTVLLYGVN
jgi:hypothetical protein